MLMILGNTTNKVANSDFLINGRSRMNGRTRSPKMIRIFRASEDTAPYPDVPAELPGLALKDNIDDE
jgi:hypothetical protein